MRSPAGTMAGDAGGPGARQPVRRAAGRQAPLVSLSPPLRRRAPRPRAGGAARSGRRPAPAGERVVRAQRSARPTRSATRWPPGTSRARRVCVERGARAMLGDQSGETFYGWLKALPDELVRARPVLSTYYAFALLGRGELEAAEARLRDAERWLTRRGRVSGRTPQRSRWSSSTTRGSGRCRGRSPSPAPTSPGLAATCPGP